MLNSVVGISVVFEQFCFKYTNCKIYKFIRIADSKIRRKFLFNDVLRNIISDPNALALPKPVPHTLGILETVNCDK